VIRAITEVEAIYYRKKSKQRGITGCWVAQSTVKHSILDFGSGRNLRVVGSSPILVSTLSRVCLDLSLFISLCPSHHSLSLLPLKKKKSNGILSWFLFLEILVMLYCTFLRHHIWH